MNAGRLRLGRSPNSGLTGGFFAKASSASLIAMSSCGSRPFAQSCGARCDGVAAIGAAQSAPTGIVCARLDADGAAY